MSNISNINGFKITAESASYAATASVILGSITTAQTASYVTASNVYGPYGANSVLSASWAPGGSGVTINNNTDNRLVTATGTAATLKDRKSTRLNSSH